MLFNPGMNSKTRIMEVLPQIGVIIKQGYCYNYFLFWIYVLYGSFKGFHCVHFYVAQYTSRVMSIKFLLQTFF